MTDPMHQQLLGHLLGALDDDEQEWVESQLEHNEEYRRHWMEWRRRLAPLLAARPEFEPPPELAERTCRLVASCAPAPRRDEPRRRKMSPDGALPDHAAHVGWLDVAAVAVILVVAAILVPPAIHQSRFHSRLASCQERLRQVGLALAQYGYDHSNPISQFADNERLTDAGQFAAELIEDGLPSDDNRTVCPEAWLASQGAVRWSRHVGSWRGGIQDSAAETLQVGPSLPSGFPWDFADVSNRDWHGTWRNGTLDGATDPLPAAVALLADAPSADLPGQAFDYHDGQGRNIFFEDGHVDFLPCSATRNAAEMFLTGGDAPATPRVSVPIRFADWH